MKGFGQNGDGRRKRFSQALGRRRGLSMQPIARVEQRDHRTRIERDHRA